MWSNLRRPIQIHVLAVGLREHLLFSLGTRIPGIAAVGLPSVMAAPSAGIRISESLLLSTRIAVGTEKIVAYLKYRPNEQKEEKYK